MEKEVQMRNFIDKLNTIKWRSAHEITDEAEKLIYQHIKDMQKVIRYFKASHLLNSIDAYARAQSAGSEDAQYGKFMEISFNEISFHGAGVRENLILDIASYYFWEVDDELKDLENPWHPLMKLFELGYTGSFAEDEEEDSITITIGFKDGIKSYKLI